MVPIRRAIILAAGLSSRLYPRTVDLPKSMLPLGSHGTLIDLQLATLERLGFEDVTVVTGHAAERLESHIGDRAQTRHYPGFANHGNLHTLHHVADLLDRSVLIAFADLVAPPELWRRMTQAGPGMQLAVDEGRCIPGTMRTQGDGKTVTDLGPHIPVDQGTGTFVGLATFDEPAALQLRTQLAAMVKDSQWDQSVYTYALAELARSGGKLHSVPTDGALWIEVDDESDHARALDLERRWPT